MKNKYKNYDILCLRQYILIENLNLLAQKYLSTLSNLFDNLLQWEIKSFNFF